MSELFDKHGGFRKLHSFTLATLVQLKTLRFCRRFLTHDHREAREKFYDPKGRQYDQMTQKRKNAKVKLADGKERNIQHIATTTFLHPDGPPMSAQQFMEMLFSKLPDFFSNEDELRELWSVPATRAKLLEGLEEKGFGHDQLAEMQKIINAENSDLFDVLAHVAYGLPPLNREERSAKYE